MGVSIEFGEAALLAPHGVAPFLRRAADLALAIARLTLGLHSGLAIARHFGGALAAARAVILLRSLARRLENVVALRAVLEGVRILADTSRAPVTDWRAVGAPGLFGRKRLAADPALGPDARPCVDVPAARLSDADPDTGAGDQREGPTIGGPPLPACLAERLADQMP